MVDGIDDIKILEARSKLEGISKIEKNDEILDNLIKIAYLPCVDGIYVHSSIFIVLYSKNNFKDFELEKNTIIDAKKNIENISNGVYTLNTYSVEEYVDPMCFFPSPQYYMNETINSGVALFESQAVLKLKKS